MVSNGNDRAHLSQVIAALTISFVSFPKLLFSVFLSSLPLDVVPHSNANVKLASVQLTAA